MISPERHQTLGIPLKQRSQPGPAGCSPPAPRHIGVILDGNRRWARHHRVALERAYYEGALRVRDLVSWCTEAGVPLATVWALSQENLRRSPDTVGRILDAVITGLNDIADTTTWRIRPIGALDLLPAVHEARLRKIGQRTVDAAEGIINVAIAYDGRDDIVTAVRGLIGDLNASVPDGWVKEADLERYLSTAGQPDIDLVIRTSGEQRLSGFMPWQTAYAEFYFTPVLWPDFSADDFAAALDSYRTRQRRYGL